MSKFGSEIRYEEKKCAVSSSLSAVHYRQIIGIDILLLKAKGISSIPEYAAKMSHCPR